MECPALTSTQTFYIFHNIVIPKHITKNENAHIIIGPEAPLNSILKKDSSIGPSVIFKIKTLHNDAKAAKGIKSDTSGCFSNNEYIHGAFIHSSLAINKRKTPQKIRDPIRLDHITNFFANSVFIT
jgi:hypothetical protein